METISNEEMTEYIREYSKRFKSFIKKLSPEELDVLMDYKRNGYYRINNVLYEKEVPISKSEIPTFFKDKFFKAKGDEVIESIKILDSMFDKVPKTIRNKIPTVLYRGSSAYSSDLKINSAVVTRGFISTSLVPYVASHFIGCEGCCIFKLLINKPLPYIYISWVSHTKEHQEPVAYSEFEILLPRNLIFKIVNIEKVSLDTNHIFCTQKEIQKSKTKKLTLYTCELVDQMEEKSIPPVKFSVQL